MMRTLVLPHRFVGNSSTMSEERYGRRSTIITSQIPVDKWHELIGRSHLVASSTTLTGSISPATACDAQATKPSED